MNELVIYILLLVILDITMELYSKERIAHKTFKIIVGILLVSSIILYFL